MTKIRMQLVEGGDWKQSKNYDHKNRKKLPAIIEKLS